MLKNIFSKFGKKTKSKKEKQKKDTQTEFDFGSLDDLKKEKKTDDNKFGFAKDTKFAKEKEKEEKEKQKFAKLEEIKEEKEKLEKEAKQRFRAGADVKVLNPSEKGKYPQEIAVRVRKPQDTKYIKIDLVKSDVTITKDTPTGVVKGDDIRIVSESGQKPKIDDIKLLGAKVRVNESGQVFYDKKPLGKRKGGFFEAKFNLKSKADKTKNFGARLKNKAGRGLRLEF
tara:strand:+ start:2832 stop:3512 length:681 start_codon:yes stop_codon:yes gene_type:complete